MEEFGVCETEHSHEHQGKVELFLMGQFSHDDGPGHVCGVVVAHGRVGSVSGDGVKAGADISLLLLS